MLPPRPDDAPAAANGPHLAAQAFNAIPDPHCDTLARVAERVFEVPIVGMSVINGKRQRLKTSRGLGKHRIFAETALCLAVVPLEEDAVLVIEDAAAHADYATDALVAGEPHIRFFAGAPLRDSDGKVFGCMWIADTRPRSLGTSDREELSGLAAAAAALQVAQRASFNLRRSASNDALTGLSNRRVFEQRLERAAREATPGKNAALFYVDLDKFKAVNDTHGHAGGDMFLREAARRMSAAVRSGETVARLGGDEFAILAVGVPNAATAGKIAQRVMEALAQPLVIGGQTLAIGASIGVALCPDDAGGTAALARAADAALYRAKEDGRGCWRTYTPAE